MKWALESKSYPMCEIFLLFKPVSVIDCSLPWQQYRRCYRVLSPSMSIRAYRGFTTDIIVRSAMIKHNHDLRSMLQSIMYFNLPYFHILILCFIFSKYPCTIFSIDPVLTLSTDICFLLHDRPWISPWLKSIHNELDISIHVIASQLSGNCDVTSYRLWRHQQNENRASETRGRWEKIVVFIVFYELVTSCKKWNNVCTLDTNCFFAHSSVILVFIPLVASQLQKPPK